MNASQIFDEGMIELSFKYVHEYKRNPKNFLNSYKKFKSIRTVCTSIVAAYKKSGAYDEMAEQEVSFKPYAYKYFDGQEARTFADILLIIYTLTNEKM